MSSSKATKGEIETDIAVNAAAIQSVDDEIADLERRLAALHMLLAQAEQRRIALGPITVKLPSCHGADLEAHRTAKKNLFRYVNEYGILAIISCPFIYATAIAFFILDVFVSLYQFVCFPVYGIQKAKRSDFILLDRHKLGYLNWVEKFNCVFCGYANGLLAYCAEIASRTEAYWCPIKHSAKTAGLNQRSRDFADYSDSKTYRQKQEESAKRCMRCTVFKKPTS